MTYYNYIHGYMNGEVILEDNKMNEIVLICSGGVWPSVAHLGMKADEYTMIGLNHFQL